LADAKRTLLIVRASSIVARVSAFGALGGLGLEVFVHADVDHAVAGNQKFLVGDGDTCSSIDRVPPARLLDFC
jgi:hypothetical protein